jgi:hypothetical protein
MEIRKILPPKNSSASSSAVTRCVCTHARMCYRETESSPLLFFLFGHTGRAVIALAGHVKQVLGLDFCPRFVLCNPRSFRCRASLVNLYQTRLELCRDACV